MKPACLLLAVLAAGAALPAGAQEGGDRVRLDDFALPGAPSDSHIDQLGADNANNAVAAAAPSDRALLVPGPPSQASAPLDQLSGSNDAGATAQLSGRDDSRRPSASISSLGDSRPQPTAALTGTDRCEPGSDAQRRAECQRILELRAAEFAAAEAPKLSAEQVLLAEHGESDAMRAANSSQLRVRLASADPDADLEVNQELASIVLDHPADPTTRLEEAAARDDAALASILQGLQIEGAGSSGQ